MDDESIAGIQNENSQQLTGSKRIRKRDPHRPKQARILECIYVIEEEKRFKATREQELQ